MSLNPSIDLSNKTALVTGGSRGLGATLSRGLGRAGARVIITGRSEETLKAQQETLGKEGIQSDYFSFDVTNEMEIARAAEEIHSTIGPLDILVNNAGINLRGPLEDFSMSDWNEVMQTNLTAPWLVSKAFVPPMLERGSGKIINIASLMSFGGRENTGPYTASKGGVALLTKAMSVEWAKHGLQCNSIAPGYFLTEMTRPLAEDKEFNKWVCSRTPSARWGNPEELVGPLLFLSSDQSTYVNGQIIYVDGGWSSKL